MPGVTLEHHLLTSPDPPAHSRGKPGWTTLADEAAQNTELDLVQLPTPPEVIEIMDDNDVVALPPLTESILPTKIKASSPPHPPSQYPTRNRQPPQQFMEESHLFTTVAEEQRQDPGMPYHTAGSTDVDLAIQDESMMAQICHYVMVHTATTLYLNETVAPNLNNKKQYGLKATQKIL